MLSDHRIIAIAARLTNRDPGSRSSVLYAKSSYIIIVVLRSLSPDIFMSDQSMCSGGPGFLMWNHLVASEVAWTACAGEAESLVKRADDDYTDIAECLNRATERLTRENAFVQHILEQIVEDMSGLETLEIFKIVVEDRHELNPPFCEQWDDAWHRPWANAASSACPMPKFQRQCLMNQKTWGLVYSEFKIWRRNYVTCVMLLPPMFIIDNTPD
jgi:hypothetical protein